MTSCFGKTRLSMFCSLVRDLEVVAAEVVVLVADVVVEVERVLDLVAEVLEVEVAAFWRRSLASCSRFSCSRSFWICFCSISERLKKRFPPVSSARDFRFFRSSCWRRSILGFDWILDFQFQNGRLWLKIGRDC